VSSIRSRSSGRRAASDTETRPPDSVYLIAFDSTVVENLAQAMTIGLDLAALEAAVLDELDLLLGRGHAPPRRGSRTRSSTRERPARR